MGERGVSERYWGGFCAQCNVWIRRPDHTLLYYPSPVLARADLTTDLEIPGIHLNRPHLFEVTEFGKERAVELDALPVAATLCPVIVEKRNRELYRRII